MWMMSQRGESRTTPKIMHAWKDEYAVGEG